jgi:hypothetical protein
MTLAEVVKAARARAEIEARIYEQETLPALIKRLCEAVETGQPKG